MQSIPIFLIFDPKKKKEKKKKRKKKKERKKIVGTCRIASTMLF